jgi:hypothetical protein
VSLTKTEKARISEAMKLSRSLGKTTEWGIEHAMADANVSRQEVVDYLDECEARKKKAK